jgi:hypothetical protein
MVMADDLMQRLMEQLSKDGKPVGFMECNNCGYVEAYQPTGVTVEQLEKEGQQTIKRLKQHFEDKGRQTSGGYDLCPECVKNKEGR